MPVQRDIVLRWIESLAKVIAKLLGRTDGASFDLARDQIEMAEREYLGGLAELAAKLDPPTLANLLTDPFRIYGYARLLGLSSAVEQAAGATERAQALRARATALGEEAVARLPDPPAEWLEWLREANGVS
jgi:hypothetical protein